MRSMKLNKSSEKAMAVIALMAVHFEDRALSSSEIATKLNLSDSYTKKILRKLVVAKIIKASSGNTGGYTFNQELTKITILMIIEAIEGSLQTFPDHGVLASVFSNHQKLATSGDEQIKKIISTADQRWAAELNKVTVNDILINALNEE